MIYTVFKNSILSILYDTHVMPIEIYHRIEIHHETMQNIKKMSRKFFQDSRCSRNSPEAVETNVSALKTKRF